MFLGFKTCVYTLQLVLEQRRRLAAKNKVGPHMANSSPFLGEKRFRKIYTWYIFIVLAITGACCLEVPSLRKDLLIMIFHLFKRSCPLARPHLGVLHPKVDIAHLAECLGVNLGDVFPHPFLCVTVVLFVLLEDSVHQLVYRTRTHATNF